MGFDQLSFLLLFFEFFCRLLLYNVLLLLTNRFFDWFGLLSASIHRIFFLHLRFFNSLLFYDICFGLLRIRVNFLFLAFSSFFSLSCTINLLDFSCYKLLCGCLLLPVFRWGWGPLIIVIHIIITWWLLRCCWGTLMCWRLFLLLRRCST
jgi:hypothetical protein